MANNEFAGSKYPEIIVDKEQNLSINISNHALSLKDYNILMYHTHDMKDLEGFENGEFEIDLSDLTNKLDILKDNGINIKDVLDKLHLSTSISINNAKSVKSQIDDLSKSIHDTISIELDRLVKEDIKSYSVDDIAKNINIAIGNTRPMVDKANAKLKELNIDDIDFINSLDIALVINELESEINSIEKLELKDVSTAIEEQNNSVKEMVSSDKYNSILYLNNNIDTELDNISKMIDTLSNQIDNLVIADESKYNNNIDYNESVINTMNDKINSNKSEIVNGKWIIGGEDTGIIAEGKNIKVSITESGISIEDYDGVTSEDVKFRNEEEYEDVSNYLSKDNTEEYTPSTQYHPATKKYVDDKFSTIINRSLLSEEGYGGLRYYNGVLQWLNTESGEWNDIELQNNPIIQVQPQSLKNFIVIYDSSINGFKVSFVEPDDTIIDNKVLSKVDRIDIVRKIGEVPTVDGDGETILSLSRNEFGKYNTDYFNDIAEFKDGDVVYYKAFIYATNGLCNNSIDNVVHSTYGECQVYGFRIDQSESDPEKMISYIGVNKDFIPAHMNYKTTEFDYGNWKDIWFIKDIKPVLMNPDGSINCELDKNDYSKTVSGEDIPTDESLNAMVGIPLVYYKVKNISDMVTEVYFCNSKPSDGDEWYNYAHINSAGETIPYTYISAYLSSNTDNGARSFTGLNIQGTYNYDNKCYNDCIKNNEKSGLDKDIWMSETAADRILITYLLMLISKTTDSQKAFGFGSGSAITDNVSGTMDKKGLFWGGQTKTSGVKVFGIEHYWGKVYRIIAGYAFKNNGADGLRAYSKMKYGNDGFKVCDPYTEEYTDTSVDIPYAYSFVSKVAFGNDYILPCEFEGASSSTFFTDFSAYTVSNSESQALRASANNGSAYGGLFAYASLDKFDTINKYYNCTLACKPLNRAE